MEMELQDPDQICGHPFFSDRSHLRWFFMYSISLNSGAFITWFWIKLAVMLSRFWKEKCVPLSLTYRQVHFCTESDQKTNFILKSYSILMDWLCLGVNLQLGEINFLEGVSDTAGCKKHFKRKPDFMNFTVQISRGFGWHSWPNPRSAYVGFVLAVCTGFGKLDWTQMYDTLFQLWPAERIVEKLVTVPQFPLCRRASFGSCFMLSSLKKKYRLKSTSLIGGSAKSLILPFFN